MDGDHESFHNAELTWITLTWGGGASSAAGSKLPILSELSYFSWFIPNTNMGESTDRADMMTLLAPLFK